MPPGWLPRVWRTLNMLNIEQELEIGPSCEYEPRNVRLEDGVIRVDMYFNNLLYDNNWSFDPKTGIGAGYESQDNPTFRLRPKSGTRPINHFFIFAGERDWAKEHWVKLTHELFTDGKSAAERMKHHNGLATTALSPFRFMVKKEVELSPVRDYPKWAEFRFETGEWKPVPWADEEWVIKDHFAHLGVQDDCMVAFYENEEMAQMDRITVLTPGRYLQRFHERVLTPTQIRDWAVKVDVECELKFATTEEEIVAIYTKAGGPSSCMQYPETNSYWTSADNKNPVRAYAAGDLALAYLERCGKVVARSLVWPEKKVCNRIYGDIERMQAALEAASYTRDCQNHNDMEARGDGGFDGAKMLPIHIGENLLMPYLDLGYRASWDGENLKMVRSGGDISGRRTDGLAWAHGCEDEDDTLTCDACGEEEPTDQQNSVPGRDDYYCDCCYNENVRTCERGSCRTQFVDGASYTVGNDSWCYSCYEEHAANCGYCNEPQPVDEMSPIHDGRDGSIYDDACEYCAENDHRIVLDHSGERVNITTVQHCGECEQYYSANADECPNPTHEEELAA